MPLFRNRNSGQVVHVEADPSHLSGLARWERIEGELSAPADDPALPWVAYREPETLGLDPDLGPPVPFVDSESETSTVAEIEAAGAELVRPADDADRDEWVAYAKAHGRTDAQLKGVRTTVIRGWFPED